MVDYFHYLKYLRTTPRRKSSYDYYGNEVASKAPSALEDEMKSPRIKKQSIISEVVLLKGAPRVTFCTDNDYEL